MDIEEAMRTQRAIGPTTRKPVGEVVSVDRYGQRPFAAG
jgi:hypothetical protein